MTSPFNKTLLPDAYDCVIVSADEEPDDLIAKGMLANALRGSTLPVLWITGQGNRDKVELVRAHLACLGLHGAVVVQSNQSSKPFPAGMFSAFPPVPYGGAAPPPVPNCDEVLTRYLTAAAHPLYIMLKPCWELLRMPPALVAKTTIAAYGSFNFRSLFGTDAREKALYTHEEIASFINGAARRVVMFESYYAVGEANTVGATDDKEFFETLTREATAGKHPAYWQGVLKSIDAWNMHMLDEQADSIARSATALKETGADSDSGVWKKRKTIATRIERSTKIISSVVAANGRQVVLADFGLLACILGGRGSETLCEQIVRCSIAFDETRGTTGLVPDATAGKVYAIKGVDRARLMTVARCWVYTD